MEENVHGLYKSQPCIWTFFGADENLYHKLEKYEHGNKDCSCIIVYVDGVLFIHNDPDKYLNLVYRYFRHKDPPEWPTMYLKEDISNFVIPNDGNGVTWWAVSADIYVKKEL